MIVPPKSDPFLVFGEHLMDQSSKCADEQRRVVGDLRTLRDTHMHPWFCRVQKILDIGVVLDDVASLKCSLKGHFLEWTVIFSPLPCWGCWWSHWCCFLLFLHCSRNLSVISCCCYIWQTCSKLTDNIPLVSVSFFMALINSLFYQLQKGLFSAQRQLSDFHLSFKFFTWLQSSLANPILWTLPQTFILLPILQKHLYINKDSNILSKKPQQH